MWRVLGNTKLSGFKVTPGARKYFFSASSGTNQNAIFQILEVENCQVSLPEISRSDESLDKIQKLVGCKKLQTISKECTTIAKKYFNITFQFVHVKRVVSADADFADSCGKAQFFNVSCSHSRP